MQIYTEDYIMHHGVKGMHWNEHLPYVLAKLTKNTRKQKMYESIAAERVKYKKRGVTSKTRKNVVRNPVKVMSAEQKRKAALQKAQATRKANAEKKKAIDDIIRTGDLAGAHKYVNDMSHDQLQALFTKLDDKNKLASYTSAASRSKADAFFKNMDKTSERIKSVTTFVDNSTKAYDSVSKAVGLMNKALGKNTNNGGGKKTKLDPSKENMDKAMDMIKKFRDLKNNAGNPNPGHPNPNHGPNTNSDFDPMSDREMRRLIEANIPPSLPNKKKGAQ